MARLLILTPAELTRDPRARRAAAAAQGAGLEVVGLCIGGAPASPLDGVRVLRVPPDALTARRSAPAAGEATSERPLLREVRGIFRLLRLARTTLRLARAGRSLDPAIVHANDFETLPAGAWLARSGQVRLVYDAHELYTAFEPRPPRLYAAILRRLEGRLARSADAVVTVSPEIASRLQTLHRLAAEPLVVLNCPALSALARPAPPSHTPLRVIYQAAAGPNRILGDLLDAAQTAVDAHFTFRVVGADAAGIVHDAAGRGIGARVEISEPADPDQLVAALAPYDVGVVIDRPATDNTDLALPNKLFEYLMAGLAVVVPRLAAMAALVERDGVGRAYTPGSPSDLGRVLGELAADRLQLDAMRARARELAVSRYNAEAQEPVLLRAWGL